MAAYFFSHGKTNSWGALVGFYGNINYSVKKKLSDNSARILVLNVTIDGTSIFWLTLSRKYWTRRVIDFKGSFEGNKGRSRYRRKNIIFKGKFNFFFWPEHRILKKYTASRSIEPKSSLTCVTFDELETLNPKHLLFVNIISLEFCSEELTVSNDMPESAKSFKMLNALSMKWNGMEFVDEMETLIQNYNYLADQVKWERLKNEIRNFSINFSKKLAQNSRKLQAELETKMKNLEQNITNEHKFNEYKTAKDELENIYENLATGVKIWSNWDWY